VDIVDLAPTVNLAQDRVPDQALVVLGHHRLDGQPVFRWCVDHAHLADAAQGHVQRARYGRSRHGEHIDLPAQLLEPLLVRHAKALLLVDDQQAQILESHISRKQTVCTDDNVHLAGCQSFDDGMLFRIAPESREHLDDHRVGAQSASKGGIVLLRENGGGHEHRDLLAIHDGFEGGAQGDFGLAIAHIADQQPVHGTWLLHIRLDVLHGAELVIRLHIWKGGFHLVLPGRVLGVGVTRCQFP